MTDSANVTSLDAIRKFRQSLLRFAEEASDAVVGLQMEVTRALEWLEHDRPHYWKAQIRKCQEQVSQARAELERAKTKQVAGHRPSCYEEKKALELAKRRLEYAQQKLEAVKRWTVLVRDEINEYRGRLGPMERCLETDLPRIVALVEKQIAALEAYLQVQAPELADALDVENPSTSEE